MSRVLLLEVRKLHGNQYYVRNKINKVRFVYKKDRKGYSLADILLKFQEY